MQSHNNKRTFGIFNSSIKNLVLTPHQRTLWLTYLDWFGIFVLIVFAVSLPVSSITSTRDICLVLTLFLWVIRSAATKNWRIRQTGMEIPWIIYGIFVILSLLTAVDFIYSLNQFRGEFLKNFLLFLLVVQFVDTEEKAKAVLWGILLGNVLMVSVGIFEFLIKDGSLTTRALQAPTGWASLHGGGGAYSTYLITILPFLLLMMIYWKKWWVSIPIVFLGVANIFSIYITFQRGAWVAFLITISGALIISPGTPWFKKVGLAILFLAVGTAAWLVPKVAIMRGLEMPSINQIIREPVKYFPRLEIWRFSIKYLSENPFKGTGIGRASPRKKYPYYNRNRLYWHAHNTLLNIGLQMGIQGLIAFVYLFVRLCWIGIEGYRKHRSESLSHFFGGALILMIIAVFFRNMFDDFFVDDTALLFWFLSGLAAAVIQRESTLSTKALKLGSTESVISAK